MPDIKITDVLDQFPDSAAYKARQQALWEVVGIAYEYLIDSDSHWLSITSANGKALKTRVPYGIMKRLVENMTSSIIERDLVHAPA